MEATRTLPGKLLAKLQGLSPRAASKLGVGLWILCALAVGAVVSVHPDRHTVTPEYRQASDKWWLGKESLYNMSQTGYLYLPQEAILYTPYSILPERLGEPLWRWTGLALLALGLWRVAGLLSPSAMGQLFLAATILVLPSSLSSAQNGQVNLPLAGLMLLVVAEIAKARWNMAALWLLLGVTLKPIALAPALLAAACYAPLRLRLLGGFLLCLGAAYMHPDHSYVTAEYRHFWQKFLLAGQPLHQDFSDCFGMLWHWGIHPSPSVIAGLRALAALFVLGFSLLAKRRFRGEPALQAFGVLFLAAIYLMLFNPRTEENSYVILAGFTALLAARDLLGEATPRGLLLVLFTLLLAVETYGPIYPLTKIWFKPLITMLLLLILVTGHFNLLKPSVSGHLVAS